MLLRRQSAVSVARDDHADTSGGWDMEQLLNFVESSHWTIEALSERTYQCFVHP